MNSVLVGMFDSKGDADSARTQLMAAGFDAGAVSTHSGESGSTSSDATDAASPHEEGGVMHFIRSLFGEDKDEESDKHDRDTYGEAFRRGAFGVTVHTSSEDNTDRAEKILNDCGAVDVDERSEQWRAEGWAGGAAASTAPTVGGNQTLKEVEEELKVGKRAVSRGGVRVFSRMTEVPIEESIKLREEHADIQRRAVDRPATEADFAAFKEGSIEVLSTAEEAVVSKTARVVGEVEVGTVASEREQVVRDTVRKTTVEVEQIPGTVDHKVVTPKI